MITYAEALRRLMEKAVPVEGMETVPLLYSTHRVLAEDIVSCLLYTSDAADE